MKIIIIGAGFTGTQLAKRLILEKNDVVLIESDEETVRHASNRLDCMVVHANGNSLETLEEVGISRADVLVALTESDELNMITCSLVDSVYPNVKKIARVRNYDYYADLEKTLQNENKTKIIDKNHRPAYGIDFMVHPDVEAAKAIVSAVEHGAITEAITFENSDFELTQITVRAKSKLAGIYLQDVKNFANFPFVVAFIEKKGQSLLPSGNTVIENGDRLGILVEKYNINSFFELCGSKMSQLKSIVLAGAGQIGTLVAEKILGKKQTNIFSKFFTLYKKTSQDFVIVESDSKRAKAASENFPSAKVFCADVTDEGFIQEENLQKNDLFIAVTSNHELNMITSAYMKSLGVERTVALVTSSGYATIARNIGIDVAVPIKDAVVDTIMSHLKGHGITGIHTIAEGSLEIVKIDMPLGSPYVGKSLKEIAIPGSYLVLLVNKKGQDNYAIPTGNTILEPDDKIVIITTDKDNRTVLDNFGVLK